MKYLMWLLKAAIFFTLFAFALNNQQAVAVNFFFGTVWKAPLVMVVLSVFAAGLALGVLLMMPRWWKKRHSGSNVSMGNSQWASTLEASPAPAISASAVTKSTSTITATHGL
jgi:lipopolysaccharide assembly protein A